MCAVTNIHTHLRNTYIHTQAFRLQLGRLLHLHRPVAGAAMPAHILVLSHHEDGLPVGEG